MPAERVRQIPTIAYEPNRMRRTLEHGVASTRIDCRLTGTIERTAGAAGDAVVQTEAVQRLINRIRIIADDFEVVPDVDMRLLWAFHLANVFEEVPPIQPVAATINAGNPSAFELTFSLHFARKYLANPVDTILPSLPLLNGLFLEVDWNTDTQGAGTEAGIGALLSAGSDTYEFTTEPQLEIRQVTAPEYGAEGRKPWAVPALRVFNTPAWAVATEELVQRFDNRKMFDLLIFRSFRNDTGNGENSVNEVSLLSTDVDILDEEPEWALEQAARQIFPAYDGVAAAAEPGPGYLFYRAAAGGRLASRIDPDRFTDLRLVFDVDAPGGGNGVISVLEGILQPWRGRTKLTP